MGDEEREICEHLGSNTEDDKQTIRQGTEENTLLYIHTKGNEDNRKQEGNTDETNQTRRGEEESKTENTNGGKYRKTGNT